MPYSRRTGKRYAAGSQATFGSWEPRVCVYGDRCLNGGRIVLSHMHALMFYRSPELTFSAHADCVKTLGWPSA